MEASDPSFHLIVMSDLDPGVESASRARIVDKDSLDELLRGIGPSVEVPNGGARSVLTIQEFRDFRPERLAMRVPAIASLLEFKKLVFDLAAGRGSQDAVRAALGALGSYPELAAALDAALASSPAAPLAAIPAGPRPATPVPEGGLFDLVDAGDGAATPDPSPDQARRAAANLIQAVLGSSASGTKPVPAELRRVGAQAESAVAPLVRAVLHDPRFRELESAWRGLRMLVRSVDFRAGCRLHVIASSRKKVLEAARESAFPLADDLRSRGKSACLLLDYSFDGSEPELRSLAEDASGRSLPLVASAGLEVALRGMAAGLGDASQAPWIQLRSTPGSRWLTLAVNRFLHRSLYGAGGEVPRDLAFEEAVGPETPLPWCRPGWLVAAFIASSFARCGWGCDFSGREAAAGLEPLPLRPGDGQTTPLETDLSEAAVHALGDAGLLPIGCRRGHDRPFAAGTSAVHQAGKDEPAATLRYALFAAPVAATLESLLGQLDPTRSLEEIARTIQAALGLMGMTESGPVYTATAVPSSGGRPLVAVRVRPLGGVLRGLPDLAFEVPIALH